MLTTGNKTKERVPSLPFSSITDKILGKRYDLSLVFVGDTTSRNLNKKYRHKDYVPNILSFPYEKNEGEIIMNLGKIKKEAKKEGVSMKKQVLYIFIHGLLHLKGMQHGSRMESEEERHLSFFG